MLVKFTMDKLDPNIGDSEYKGKYLRDWFSGHIEIRMPSYPERLRFPKEIGIESLSESGDDANKLVESLKNLELLAVCAEKVKPYVAGVEVTILDDGSKLASADDLYDHPGAGTLVAALCTKFILGFLEKKT